jgi:hypothetical protein
MHRCTLAIALCLTTQFALGQGIPSAAPLPQITPAKLLPAAKAVKGPEAVRLRVLLVLDTDDRQGFTWGRDGDNMKVLLEASLKRLGKESRFTLDMFTGAKVTPDNILTYYRGLAVGPGETLLFYYSGHGGLHWTKGHYMALTHGKLYRNDLLEAMASRKPQLRVLLTDCCANYYGGASPKEPPQLQILAGVNTGNFGAHPKAIRQAPPGEQIKQFVMVKTPTIAREPPRPQAEGSGHSPKAPRQEPPGGAIDPNVNTGKFGSHPKAKREEPAGGTIRPGGVSTSNRPLATFSGPVDLQEIVARTDGKVLNDLLFRHAGVVDINGCTKGELSNGTMEWGGSLFTNAFLALMRNHGGQFDVNNNRVVEWSEFFPYLQQGTLDAGNRLPRGRVRQIPEAFELKATPITP